MVGLTEKARAFFREHPVTTERKVNQYLTEQMPRLVREYKLATTKDSTSIDDKLKKNETAVDELESWQSNFTATTDELKKRVSKLEVRKG